MIPADQELVEKAKLGDKQAFTELFRIYKDRIFGYLGRYIGDYHTAEDLTIETFLSAYNHLSGYKAVGSFSSWIYAIATNCAKMELRRRARHRETSLEEAVGADADGLTLGDTIADGGPKPDYEARKKELKGYIYRILAKLPGKYKEALLLRYVEGLGYIEAGRVLGCNPITVATRIRRGRAMLYEVLKRYGYDLGI